MRKGKQNSTFFQFFMSIVIFQLLLLLLFALHIHNFFVTKLQKIFKLFFDPRIFHEIRNGFFIMDKRSDLFLISIENQTKCCDVSIIKKEAFIILFILKTIVSRHFPFKVSKLGVFVFIHFDLCFSMFRPFF